MEKMKELINTFSKDLEEIKKKQTEMNNPATEIKNTLEGIYSRKTETEEWISKLEDRMVEITKAEQNKEKRITRKDSLRDLWNIKCTNIQIIQFPEKEDKKKCMRNNLR